MMFFPHCTKGIIIITSRLLSVWFTDSSEDDFGNVFAWSAPAVFSQRSRSLATAIKPDHALMTKGQDISSISDRAVRKIWLLGSRDWCSYKEFTNKCVFFCQHQEHLLSNLTIFYSNLYLYQKHHLGNEKLLVVLSRPITRPTCWYHQSLLERILPWHLRCRRKIRLIFISKGNEVRYKIAFYLYPLVINQLKDINLIKRWQRKS